MGKRTDKTGRSKGESRHVRIYHWLLNTPSWQHLNALERAVYVEIASRYNGTNNGKIAYAIRDVANSFKVGKSTAARAFKTLEYSGFVCCVTKGAFSVKLKLATEWRLTEFNCDVSGELASKDFTRKTEAELLEQRKVQNSVPVVGLSVPVVGPNGTCGGTRKAQNTPNGTCGGTDEAPDGDVSVPVVGHIYFTRGTALEGELPSSKENSYSSSLQPDSPKAKPSSAAHLLETNLMKRQARLAQRTT